MASYREAFRAVGASWYQALNWTSIILPPLVAFADNVASIQIVAGQSMSPTLNPDSSSMFLDMVLVSKTRDFRAGDVILLKDPIHERPTRIIKRVSEVTNEGKLIFVLGDNRGHSTDSRHFGFVPSVMVEGVVTRVVFPPWRVSKVI